MCRYSSRAKFSLLPVFVNKALLEQSTSLHLRVVNGCFPTAKAELTSCSRDPVACKFYNSYLALSGKSLPTLGVG